jgi:hypothetical protein
MRAPFHIFILFFLLLTLNFAYAEQPRQGQTPQQGRGQEYPNGISVGRPKVFDSRTLMLMLESLSENLRTIQFVDQKSLATALGLSQGFQSTESVSNLTVNPVPIPSLKQENVTTTGNVSSTGAPLADTTKSTTTTSRDVLAPQPPTLENPAAFSGFTPNYGENAADLLSDQVNLSYQIFNLRTILDRSLSDRVLIDGKARRQAVLGFNITIDPPRTAADSVAVVEVTLDAAVKERDGISIVALMPQEKTYNSAAISTKSNAFGGAAVVNVFQVGYSQRERSQTFYLYRDTDTISYERMNDSNPNEVVFGWMFRPVLGRRSISPGSRQLFAILALPAEDASGTTESWVENITAHVRTYWKKYDAKTMTSFEERDATRTARFLYGISLNLDRPKIFDHRYENHADYADIEVKPTEDYQRYLSPTITSVDWRAVGSKTIIVSVKGDNFFTGTQVAIGDKVYSNAGDGLIIKSAQAMDLTTSLDALASQASIIGRYGASVPLVNGALKAPPEGIKIESSDLTPGSAGFRALRIKLRALGTCAGNFDFQEYATPIVTINGAVVPLPYGFSSEESGVLQASVPEALVSKGGGLLRVSYPFLSANWTATFLIADPAANFQVIRLSSRSIVLYVKGYLGFVHNPHGDDPSRPYCWKMLATDKPIILGSDSCKSGDKGTEGLSSNAISVRLGVDIPENIVLISPENAVFSLTAPKLVAADASSQKPITLNQYDAVWVDIGVKDVSKVASVEANQVTIKYRVPAPDKDGNASKIIQAQIPRDLTAKPGDVDLTVLDKDGMPIGSARLHISPSRSDKGEKQ